MGPFCTRIGGSLAERNHEYQALFSSYSSVFKMKKQMGKIITYSKFLVVAFGSVCSEA